MANPYIKTDWQDHIVDVTTGETIQEGTRFTARRANNIEDGIYNAYDQIESYKREIDKLRVQMDLIGRSPSNNGTFFDPINGDEPKLLQIQTEKATVQDFLAVGATSIPLDTVPFSIGDYATIYDEEGYESVKVTGKTASAITVTALVGGYKKGAYVARSNAVLDFTQGKLTFGSWGTYQIKFSEVV